MTLDNLAEERDSIGNRPLRSIPSASGSAKPPSVQAFV